MKKQLTEKQALQLCEKAGFVKGAKCIDITGGVKTVINKLYCDSRSHVLNKNKDGSIYHIWSAIDGFLFKVEKPRYKGLLKKEKPFKLEKYWQIERNEENFERVNDYFNKKYGQGRYTNNKEVCISDGKISYQYIDGCQILTTEQFDKYVLGKTQPITGEPKTVLELAIKKGGKKERSSSTGNIQEAKKNIQPYLLNSYEFNCNIKNVHIYSLACKNCKYNKGMNSVAPLEKRWIKCTKINEALGIQEAEKEIDNISATFERLKEENESFKKEINLKNQLITELKEKINLLEKQRLLSLEKLDAKTQIIQEKQELIDILNSALEDVKQKEEKLITENLSRFEDLKKLVTTLTEEKTAIFNDYVKLEQKTIRLIKDLSNFIKE